MIGIKTLLNNGKPVSIVCNFLRYHSQETPKTTCLWAFHKSRNARTEKFAGYLMPIVYKNQSIKEEHFQTRQSASAFDVSHMMQVLIYGKDRMSFLESLTVADLEALPLNKCTLSLFPNEKGGIIDDCVIANKDDHLQLVSNAGNAEIVWNWLNDNIDKRLDVTLVRQYDRGLIALQGPLASQVLQKLINVDLTKLSFMNCRTAQVSTIADCQITRCGYTGEDGFEISVRAEDSLDLMETICRDKRVKPAGLGARDTLRLEAGLCLHGHDITPDTTPIEASLNWVVHKRRRQIGGFPGFDTIKAQLAQGVSSKRVGLIAEELGPPAREGVDIFDIDGKSKIGSITSGTASPSLSKNIAMGYVSTGMSKNGQEVLCSIRGKFYKYKVTKMPFVPSKYYTATNVI